MLDILIDAVSNPRLLAMVFAAVAAIATVLTLAMPLLATDTLGKRMKAVALEREKMRQRERERLARGEKVALRRSPKQYMQSIVDQFNLNKWVGQETARAMLVQAGYRGQAPYVTYLFFRMLMPVVMLVVLAVLHLRRSRARPAADDQGRASVSAPPIWACTLPSLFLKNRIQHRQLSIKRAFPDALDLLLICVESGMSIEAGFKRVSAEIGTQSIALAEELTLTTAELSYLQDRRQAYENLAKRTNLEGVKSVCMALQQAERYGTPMAHDAARHGAGKPRHAHVGSREEGRRPAAQADRADDRVLPAGAVHRHSRPGRDPVMR